MSETLEQVMLKKNEKTLSARNLGTIEPGFWFTPIGSRIVAEVEIKKKKQGLIVETKSALDEPILCGIVKAVGPKASTIQLGDKVMFGKYSGLNVPSSSTERIFVSFLEDEIVGIVDDAALDAATEADAAKKQKEDNESTRRMDDHRKFMLNATGKAVE